MGWDQSPIHSPIGSGAGRLQKTKSNENWDFNPGVIGGHVNGNLSGRSQLGIDSFDLDFHNSNGYGDTNGQSGTPEFLLKTRSEDSASTQLDAEFKRKVERLLRSDHDDEIDLFPDILAVKKAENAKAKFIQQYGSKLKGVASIKLPSGLNAEIAPKTAAAVLSSTPHKNGEMSEPKKESELPEEPVDEGKLVGHELIKPEQTGILPEALQSQYKFARVCTLCFIQRKVGFDGFHHKPPSGHQCAKNILVVQSKDSDIWCRVRNMPRHIDYRGPFLLCRHISQGEACPYADACTFCYNEEEQEIWAWERRGLFNRTRLFTETVVDPVAHFLRQYQGTFFICCELHLEDPPSCHCPNKNLYYLGGPGLRPMIIRDTPDEKTMELCRYSSTNRCNRGNNCYFAHSMVELDAWRFFATGGSGDMIVQAIQEQNSKKEHQMAPIVSNLTFNFKHKWICAQCFKNGQTVERKGKTHYCAARISHSWRDPMLYAHIDKWSIVRDLMVVFSKSSVSLPITFVVCKNIRDKHRCDYGDVCQFAHSEEECRVWNYMKENNVKSLKDLYKKLVKA